MWIRLGSVCMHISSMTVRLQGSKRVRECHIAKVKVAHQRLIHVELVGHWCAARSDRRDFPLHRDSLSLNIWKRGCPLKWALGHILSLRKRMRWWEERGWMWASRKYSIPRMGGKRLANLVSCMSVISCALIRTYMRDIRNWSHMSKRNVRRVPLAQMCSLLRITHLIKTIQ